jgi:hypothetical protein
MSNGDYILSASFCAPMEALIHTSNVIISDMEFMCGKQNAFICLKYPQTNGRFVINHISSTIMNSSNTFRFCDNYMGNCFIRQLFHHYIPNSNAISGFFQLCDILEVAIIHKEI